MDERVLEFFGLDSDPFGREPDPRMFHPTRAHSSAAEELGDRVRRDFSLTVLRGPRGSGKTTVLRLLAHDLPERFELVVVDRARRRLGGLWTAVAHELGLVADGPDREAREAVEAHIDERTARAERTAIAIDDAHTLPDFWVTELDRMTEPEKMTIVLACAGRPVGTSRLPEAERVRRRVVETLRVRPILETECSGYLQALLMAAGARESRLFDDEAVATLYELSGGQPGRLAALAARAMELARERDEHQVDEAAVLTVAEELADEDAPLSSLRSVKSHESAPEPVETAEDPRLEPVELEQLKRLSAAAAGGGAPGHPASGPGPRPVHASPDDPTGAFGEPQAAYIPAGVGPEVRRRILSGARRPDRPAWDRSKTDPCRVAGPEEAPFGPDMLPVIADPHGAAAEWFRNVRMGLEEWMGARQRPTHSMMVTSAESEAGKTFVAVNLALLFANEPGHRVLIIDGDLRRPRFEALFGIPRRPGLADVIAGRAEISEAMQYVSEVGLYVLPAGRAGNPRDLVSPQRLAPVLEEAKGHADLIILDSPPMHGGVDARAMAASVDGVLFAARAGQTRAPDLVRAMRALDRKNLIGAIVTGVQG